MAVRVMTTLVFILSLFEAYIYAQSTTSTPIFSTANITSENITSIASTADSTPIASPSTTTSTTIFLDQDNQSNQSHQSSSVHNIFITQNIIYVILMVLFIIIIILCFILICYVRAKTHAIKRKFNAFELRQYNNQYLQHATPTQTDTKIDMSIPSQIPQKQDEQRNGTLTTANHPMILPPPIIIGNLNRIPACPKNVQITPINSRPVHALQNTPMDITAHVLSHTPTEPDEVRIIFQSNQLKSNVQIEGHGIDINSSTDESMYIDHDPEILDGPRTTVTETSVHDQNSSWPVQQKLSNNRMNNEMLSEISHDSHDTEEKYFEPVESHDAEEKLDVMVTKGGLTIENKVADTSNKYKALEQQYIKQIKELDNVKQTKMIESLSLEVQIDVQSVTQRNNYILSKMSNSNTDVKKDILFPNGKRNKVCIRNYQEFFSK